MLGENYRIFNGEIYYGSETPTLIGKIDYTMGKIIGETNEYSDEKKFIENVKDDISCGREIQLTLYLNNGKTIAKDWIFNLETLGFPLFIGKEGEEAYSWTRIQKKKRKTLQRKQSKRSRKERRLQKKRNLISNIYEQKRAEEKRLAESRVEESRVSEKIAEKRVEESRLLFKLKMLYNFFILKKKMMLGNEIFFRIYSIEERTLVSVVFPTREDAEENRKTLSNAELYYSVFHHKRGWLIV